MIRLGSDPTYGPDDNEIYGPVDTQTRVKDSFSVQFPDKYAWFATEAFWSQKCKKSYALVEKGDDQDPRCDKETCKDNGSNPPDPAL